MTNAEIRLLVTDIQKRLDVAGRKMRSSANNTDAAYFNGRAAAFQEAIGQILRAQSNSIDNQKKGKNA